MFDYYNNFKNDLDHINKNGRKELSVVGYLQALNNLIAKSNLIYQELKYERESEKKEIEEDIETTGEE